MTLEHAQQLIEALYSGDFKQTKAQLGLTFAEIADILTIFILEGIIDQL